MDGTLRHAEMCFIKSDRNVLINTVAHVSKHIFLESDGLEFDLVFDFLLAELKLFGSTMIQ